MFNKIFLLILLFQACNTGNSHRILKMTYPKWALAVLNDVYFETETPHFVIEKREDNVDSNLHKKLFSRFG